MGNEHRARVLVTGAPARARRHYAARAGRPAADGTGRRGPVQAARGPLVSS
jgi:hypothetical protein